MRYDFIVVGSGLFGATFTQKAVEAGKKCLVLERRNHIAGNVFTEEIEGIQVHKYGAHIFHTNDESIWRYVNRFARFHDYIHEPLANYHGKLYNLPFNMNTFKQIWGVTTPEEARAKIEHSRMAEYTENPQNLEQMAVNLVGREIFDILIRGYTEKQWGRRCVDLPPSIITRIPVRFTYNNNYFNDIYQGIPIGGYTGMVRNMLMGAEVLTGVDYLEEKEKYDGLAKHIVFTGPIDEYFGHRLGHLEYRSVYFETEILDVEDYQNASVINFTDIETSFTRIIEHKHFEPGNQPKTVISREFSREWEFSIEPYYPIEDASNIGLYTQYSSLANNESNITFGGRLGLYKYLDMDKTIELALECAIRLGC